MSDTPQEKKRGRQLGYRKENSMTGRIALRVPQGLEDWLREEGARKGLGIGDMARMYLMEIWNEQR
jgi:hypothetical protein